MSIKKVLFRTNATAYEYSEANNTLFSYPITLRGHHCWPTDLQRCVGDSSFQQDPCCLELKDKNASGPENSVSDHLLIVLSMLITAILVFVRLIPGYWGYLRRAPYYLSDSLMGLLFSLVNTGITTNIIKFYIGRPRPCFYALQFFASYSAKDFTSLIDKGYRSFPSGHASLSMAGLFYVTLVFFDDISKLSQVP